MCEGCVSAVITVCQQSTGVCYQQVCFIDRCVSLRLLCFIGSGETGMLVSFPLISIIKTAPANKRSQASLFISELSALLVWTHATPVISPRSYNSVCWFLFWAFKWHFGGSPASGYISLFTASRFLRAQLLKTAQGGPVSYMNLCLCFGRLKSILCDIFSSTFLFSAFFILVFWHKSWVTSLLYVRDQRSFESWKHSHSAVTQPSALIILYQVCCHTCTVLTYDQQQIDRGPLRIGRTTVPAHLVVRVFPETQRHLTAGQSALDTWRQPVHPEGQILWWINRQAVGRGRG